MDFSRVHPQIHELQKIFKQKKWTLGFAESCTGGLISAAVVSVPGVSSFYKGGVISYAGALKENLLDVPSDLIRQYGEVSLPVVKAMAQGGSRLLKIDWCLSVSGIAGPDGGSEMKPVGTVCFGLLGPGFEEQRKALFSSTSTVSTREDIQQKSVLFAFDFLLNAVR